MAMGEPAWQAKLVAAGLGLLLAACATPTAPVVTPPAVAEVQPPVELGPPPPRPPRKPPSPASLAALTPKAVPPAAETQGIDQLQGLDRDQTASLLGEPAERAEAPPALLWRYASHDCALDVYFYLDLESREMRVLHYEVRNTDGSKRPQQKCYDELIASPYSRAERKLGSSSLTTTIRSANRSASTCSTRASPSTVSAAARPRSTISSAAAPRT